MTTPPITTHVATEEIPDAGTATDTGSFISALANIAPWPVWAIGGTMTAVLITALAIAATRRRRDRATKGQPKTRDEKIKHILFVGALAMSSVVLVAFFVGTFEGAKAFANEQLGWHDWREIIPWATLDFAAFGFSLWAIRAVKLERSPSPALRVVVLCAGMSGGLQLMQGGEQHKWQAGIFLAFIAILGALVLHTVIDQLDDDENKAKWQRNSRRVPFGLRWITYQPGTLLSWLAWINHPNPELDPTVPNAVAHLESVRAAKAEKLRAAGDKPRWALIAPWLYAARLRAAVTAQAARHTRTVADVEARHAEIVAAVRGEAAANVARLEQRAAHEIAELETNMRAQIADEAARAVATADDLNQRADLRAQELTQKINALRADHAEEVRRVRADAAQAIENLRAQHHADLRTQTAQVRAETTAQVAAQTEHNLRAQITAEVTADLRPAIEAEYAARQPVADKPRHQPKPSKVSTLHSDTEIAEKLWDAYAAQMRADGMPLSRYRVEQMSGCKSTQALRVLARLAQKWSAQVSTQTGGQRAQTNTHTPDAARADDRADDEERAS